jgi:hypothetical protein
MSPQRQGVRRREARITLGRSVQLNGYWKKPAIPLDAAFKSQHQQHTHYDASGNIQCEHCINVKLSTVKDPPLLDLFLVAAVNPWPTAHILLNFRPVYNP